MACTLSTTQARLDAFSKSYHHQMITNHHGYGLAANSHCYSMNINTPESKMKNNKVCTTKVCTTKVCIAKVCTAKVCTTEVYTTKVCIAKVYTTKVCTTEVCTFSAFFIIKPRFVLFKTSFSCSLFMIPPVSFLFFSQSVSYVGYCYYNQHKNLKP